MVNVKIREVLREKWGFACSTCRLFALGFAILQAWVFPSSPFYAVPIQWPVLAAAVYTCLKLLQPASWQQTTAANLGLLTFDMSIAAALFLLTGGIHSPFLLYTLVPVLSASLVLSMRMTGIIGGITGGYVLAVFIKVSAASSIQTISALNDFPFYLTALGSAAILPYLINRRSREGFQSKAILGERRRLAREIHDGLCQEVCGLRWRVKELRSDGGYSQTTSRNLEQIGRLLDEIEQDARSSIDLLRGFKPNRPLLLQIEDWLREMESETGIECRLETEAHEPGLDELVAVETFHVLEEILRNVAKHSNAHRVVVKLKNQNGLFRVTVTDDGRGFAAAAACAEGRGLTVMRERAESVGGSLWVTSSPGAGTEIRLEVPGKWCQRPRRAGPSASLLPTTMS